MAKVRVVTKESLFNACYYSSSWSTCSSQTDDVYMGSQVVVGFFIIDLNKVQGERPHEADVSAERFPYSQILIKCSIYCKVTEKWVSLVSTKSLGFAVRGWNPGVWI